MSVDHKACFVNCKVECPNEENCPIIKKKRRNSQNVFHHPDSIQITHIDVAFYKRNAHAVFTLHVLPSLASPSPVHWHHHCLLVLCFPLKPICASDSWIPAAVTTVTFLGCRVQVCPFLQRSSVLDQGHKPYTTNQASELDRGNLSLAPTPYSALVKHLRCSERMSILWHTTTLPKFPLSQNCPSLFGKLLDKLSLVSPTTLQTKSNCKHIHSSRV